MRLFRRIMCLALAAALTLTAVASAEVFLLPQGLKRIEEDAFGSVDFPGGVFVPSSVEYIGHGALGHSEVWGFSGTYAETFAENEGLDFRPVDITNLSLSAPGAVSPFREFSVSASCDSQLPVTYSLEVTLDGRTVSALESQDGAFQIRLPAGGALEYCLSAVNSFASQSQVFDSLTAVYPPVALVKSEWIVEVGQSIYPVSESEQRQFSLSCADAGIVIDGASLKPTALGVYTVTAVAQQDEGEVYTDFTVNAVVPAADISAGSSPVTLYVGDTHQLSPTVSPSGAYNVISYSSSDESIAVVDAEGLISAVGGGTCSIYLSTFDVQAEVAVIVKQRPESIVLSASTRGLSTGETLRVLYSVFPENADNVAVTWHSSNSAVASVDQAGYVRGLSAGIARISAVSNEDSSIVGEIDLMVSQGATGIEMNAPEYMYAGSHITLAPELQPEGVTSLISLSSSNSSVISTLGHNLYAHQPGKAVITARTSNGVTVSKSIDVFERASSVHCRVPALYLNPGLSANLANLVNYSPSSVRAAGAVYSSSDPQVASVNASGRVTAVSAGTALLTVRLDSVSLVLPVYVVNDGRVITGLSTSLTYATPTVGDSFKLDPVATGTAPAAKYRQAYWYSLDPDIADISALGNNCQATVKAKAPGLATICAVSSSGVIARVNVQVNPLIIKQLGFLESSLSMTAGESITLDFTHSPAGASTDEVYMDTSDHSVAAFGEGFTLNAYRAGSCSVIVTDENVRGEIPLTVSAAPMESAWLENETMQGSAGNSAKIIYSYTPPTASPNAFSWSSSNTGVATVNSAGVVSFISAGTSNLTGVATDGSGLTLALTVQVQEIPVRELALASSSFTIKSGESKSIVYSVYPLDASYSTATFSSSDTSIAKVDASGKVTGQMAGETDISVTVGRGSYKLTRTLHVKVERSGNARYRALVMGQWTNTKQSGYLPFSRNGTQGVVDALKQSHPDGTSYSINYIGSSPSKSTFQSAVNSLANAAKPEDVTVIFILTHGAYSAKNGGYSFSFSASGDRMTGDTLMAGISSISGHVVLVLCTCYSGKINTSSRLSAIKNNNGNYTGKNGPGRLSVITSSTDTLSTYYNVANEKASYDFFSKAFTRGLGWDMIGDKTCSLGADSNHDGKVSVSEIARYSASQTQNLISAFVQQYGTDLLHGNIRQYPTRFIASGDESLILIQR
ncbi:MAG: Ig-like domain-containing protein [Clostridiales bacterium]|nr:Ig-like domain-containing protein [Clostridiales bacterium]